MANLESIALLAELDGVLPVDKPANIAAHDVVKAVRSRFNLAKAGHGGTLPPNATGLFPVLIGNGTRLAAGLMAADAAFEAELALGRATNTGDAEGETVSEADASGVSREAFDAALASFRGDIFQRPPEYSVIKMPNRPAYDIVRTPDEERAERLVHVYRFSVLEFAPPRVSISVSGTKGISLRALADDLGRALGCGASLRAMRRVKLGRWTVEDAIPFMDVMKMDAMEFRSRVAPMSEIGRR